MLAVICSIIVFLQSVSVSIVASSLGWLKTLGIICGIVGFFAGIFFRVNAWCTYKKSTSITKRLMKTYDKYYESSMGSCHKCWSYLCLDCNIFISSIYWKDFCCCCCCLLFKKYSNESVAAVDVPPYVTFVVEDLTNEEIKQKYRDVYHELPKEVNKFLNRLQRVIVLPLVNSVIPSTAREKFVKKMGITFTANVVVGVSNQYFITLS